MFLITKNICILVVFTYKTNMYSSTLYLESDKLLNQNCMVLHEIYKC